MESVGLDQVAFQIHGGALLRQNRALVILAGVHGGLGNRRTDGLEVEGHLSNESPATAIGRGDGGPLGLSVAHQKI